MWLAMVVVFAAGCLGGFVNSLITGELKLPHLDAAAKVYRPGWLGNVVIGGVAALAFWAFYGSLAKTALIGEAVAIAPVLTLGDFAGSIFTGIGGSRLISSELEKRALANTRDTLAQTVLDLTKRT